MRSKAAKIFSAMTVGVLLTGTLLTGISASAATGPKFIYTFDDLATGSNAFDSKIVEKIMPESGLGVDFNAKINADSSKNKLETGKGLLKGSNRLGKIAGSQYWRVENRRSHVGIYVAEHSGRCTGLEQL